MNTIRNIINEVAQISASACAPDLTWPVAGLLENGDKAIDVAVVGQFKSGKSSLINSLLGETMLPVGVVPVTAIVTRIRYGILPKLIIRFTDGKELETTLDELPDYVTEKLNPENIKEVAQAIVEHPALEPFKKINLVDTPGLGSFYRNNDQTTLDWLPYTGIAFLSISAERPLSEDDINLIKGIAQYSPELALILTKCDLYSTDQLAEIKNYISDSVKKATGHKIPLFEYSIYSETERYREAILEQLIVPISRHSTAKLNEIIHHKTGTIIDQSLQYTELAYQAAIKQKSDKDAVKSVLKELQNNRHYSENEMLLTSSSFKGDTRKKLEDILLPALGHVTERLNYQFDMNFKHLKGTLNSSTKLFEMWLKEKIGFEVTRLDAVSYDQVNTIVKEFADYYQYAALQFRHRLDEKLFQIYGVKLPEAYWQVDFSGIDKPDVTIYRVFDSHLDMLLFFLPMRLFGRFFRRHFKKQIPLEAEKNLHRYISDLNGNIFKSIDSVHKQARQYISSELTTVENLLMHQSDNVMELQKSLDRLKEIKTENYGTKHLV